jgi:hypothetical protein
MNGLCSKKYVFWGHFFAMNGKMPVETLNVQKLSMNIQLVQPLEVHRK